MATEGKIAMNACITCKSRIPSPLGPDFSRCALESRQDPVTGTTQFRHCSVMRQIGEQCGPLGNLWEAAIAEAAE